MADMSRTASPDNQDHPKAVLQDAADINRLIIRLFTRWTLPHVEIHIQSLPAVVVQMFQNRISRIQAVPTGGLALILACAAVLVGFLKAWIDIRSIIWTFIQVGQYLGLVAIAALYAAAIGKGIGVISMRVRLMLVLRHLRRQLDPGGTVATPARYVGNDLSRASIKARVTVELDDVEDIVPATRAAPPLKRRTKVVLHKAADTRKLLIHLFTHLKLPVVQISVDGVAPLDVQRAQHRAVQLTDSCTCLLAATLAGATLLIGSFSAAWLRNYYWDWRVPEGLGSLGLLSTAVLCAALAGFFFESIWTRVKLMLVLRGVRHHLAT
jgi:hypothetical protein